MRAVLSVPPDPLTPVVGAHSHIRSLGLDSQLRPLSSSGSAGLIGQTRARRALGVLAKIIQSRTLAGRAILLTGAPGTGKTALALALSRELGGEIPFVMMAGSEVYSMEISKTEAITQALRKSIHVKIKEEGEVIEGEVIEIQVDRSYHHSVQSKRECMCSANGVFCNAGLPRDDRVQRQESLQSRRPTWRRYMIWVQR